MTIFRTLVLGFGVGLALEASAAEPTAPTPVGNREDWILTSDYPPAALKERQQGVVGFQLQVDASGQVEKCELTAPSGSSLLDAVTCDLMTQRARFAPATDARGQVVKGSYGGRVRWVVPKLPPKVMTRTTDAIWETTFIVETDGRITDCKVLQNTSSDGALAFDPCAPDILPKGRGPITSSGRPVRTRITNRSASKTEFTTTVSEP